MSLLVLLALLVLGFFFFGLLGLIKTAIVGLIVGAIAKLIMPGRDAGGIIMTILLGIGGSFVGTFIGRMFFSRYYAAGWIMSVIGAIILLALYRMFAGRKAESY
ncbi:MAG TPA: GlsB/YeaQ/YmgE family stress response membrane protein [Blastocatellia bacterium]|nr:GlsB/YeaQ/YmgE family stress response membrane protein [Blastocatellia bacterium]